VAPRCRWRRRAIEASRSMSLTVGMQHSDLAVLTVSWELALRADGDADNTVKAYQNAVRSLADWLAEHPIPRSDRPSWSASPSRAGWSRFASATPATPPEAGSPGCALLPLAPERGQGRPGRYRRGQDAGPGRSRDAVAARRWRWEIGWNAMTRDGREQCRLRKSRVP
jgi:hypothetical protein